MPRFSAGRAAFTACLFVLGTVAVGAQLDRATRRDPALASTVPSVIRSISLKWSIGTALRRGNNEHAYKLAQDLVRRKPIPAESLTALAFSANLSGHQDVAVEALALAASRGWRDVLAQRATALAALNDGNWKVAAERTAALWRIGDSGEMLDTASLEVLRSPVARPIFLRQIAAAPIVVQSFTEWAVQNVETEALGEVVGSLRSYGARFDCTSLSTLVAKAVRGGKINSAAEVWNAACAKASQGRIKDYAFRHDGQAGEGPLDWAYPNGGGLERKFRRRENGVILMKYRNINPIRVIIASRLTGLSVGRHNIRGIEHSGSPVQIRLTCLKQGGGAGASQIADVETSGIVFYVPGQGCAVQRVDLLALRGSGAIAGLTID